MQEKVITFSLQVCLSKKPPNHLWLKHRDCSRGKMLSVAALPASLSGFHSPLFSHAEAHEDSMVDCCCLPAFRAALGGLRPCPRGGQSSHQCHPSSKWWDYLESQQGLCNSRAMLVITLPCNYSGYNCRAKNWETLSDKRLAFPDLLLFSKF